MNYRVLFIISTFILVIGFGGLFMLPNAEDANQAESAAASAEAPKQPEVVTKVITTATLNRDVTKGTLIQAEDYTLSELTVPETSPMISSDLKSLLETANTPSLQGFVATENIKAGSLVQPELLVTPNDPRFILFSINPNQEVAYRVYIQNNEQYILDSVRSGDTVSVFSQQTDLAHRERDQGSLVKLVDNLTVLQVKTFTAEENKQDSSHNKDFLGYISLKVDASMLKAFYSLDKQAKLIVLPTDAAAKAINHRGMFIRQLRGKNNAN
ncbi:SAF domain-containing protein [Actinobacillus equuli]|uniref:Flp operon protein C n=1 Tax=Actinobacillus equuli TaxID=718 RepID=A0AAX3FGT2_ACTEU|nr:SAF domain-containing protein [Actinobacillus equuli]AIZ79019.1 flp operon protein C [Actinobacillus equuli subsp. equuli]WGE45265.1 SAF domain-containing protein [Actinobacillus equuli subsp. equuli]VEE89104.1 flp operon protein C [Actinobacillus equuli]